MLRGILEQMWGAELLFYASDYPHWHFEAHERALFDAVAPEGKPEIMGGNAAAFYRLSRATS